MVSFMLLRISNGGGVGQLLFPVAIIPANDVADFGVFCHSRNVAIEAWRLLAGAIDRLYGQIGEFERGNAAQIDGTDFGPIGTNAICKGLRSACLTELMVDLVRVEGIGSKCIFARQQRKAVLRKEAKQQPFPAAVRAIATDRVFRFIGIDGRSEEHTSDLQSLMRIS